MSSLTVVEFETSTFSDETYVSELAEGPPYTVHGVALGAGDITVGQSGIKKKWPEEELREAAETLQGTNLVVDHENNADGVVGRVTKSGFKEGTGVIYEAELYDDNYAEKIKNGLLEVSIRGFHADVDSLEEESDTDAKIVEDITFDNLSIVPTGAAPSNTLQMGEHAELSAAELSKFTDTLDEASLIDEAEPGMWVQWGDGNHGITIARPSDGEIEVDVYTEGDGEWHSTEKTEMVSVDSIEEWDVDEGDIGPAPTDDKDGSNSNEEEQMESDMSIPMPGSAQLLYDTQDKAMQAAKMMGLDGIHKHDFEGETWYMPGEDHAAFEKVMASDEEEMESIITEGMKFFSTMNDTMIVVTSVSGNVVAVKPVDSDHGWDEEVNNIVQKMADGDWKFAGHMDDEEMTASDATYSQGDWVRWDTRNSTEIGKVVGSYEKGDDIPDIRGSRGLSPEGDEVLYTLRMYKERDGTFHPIEGKPIGHYEESVRSAEEPSNVSDSPVELGRSNHQNYDVEEEEWVQWYPSEMTEEHGFVLDVDDSAGDDDESIVTIEVWTQNSDGEWETDGEEITKTMEEVEPWGNFPRKQEEFADAISGEDPRRAVKPSEEKNADSDELISEEVKSALKDKAEKHNEEYGDEEGKEVTYRMLKNVFERGMGAYQDSHREGMSAQQWSYARVNAFLYLVRNGNPENDQYVQDNDLLPEDHPKYNEDATDGDEEENAASLEASNGDWVKWRGVNNEPQYGQILSIEQDGQQMVASVRRFTENCDPLDEIVEKPIQGLDRWDRMMHDSDSPDDMRSDPTSVEPPEWEEGQMVEWQVNPMMRGKIVHVDREKKIIMVEVMENTEQGLQSSGFTVTAGYSDLRPMDQEMNAVSTRDMPTQDHSADHDSGVNSLLKQFVNEYDGASPSIEEFVEWMESENLSYGRNEGEEDVLETEGDLRASRETERHRFIDAEDESSAELGDRYDDYPEAASENAQMALDAKEETDNPNDCGTDVGWKRARQLANREGITREQLGKMSAFNRHRSNSEMDSEQGRADCGWMMWKAWGGDEGVDWAQEKLDSIEESATANEGVESSDAVEALQDYEMHEPDWSGTTERDWSSPDMEDFETDDLGEIADHFLISSSGFPPENFGDLKLPIVEPNGDLNVNALAAVKGGRGASAVDGLSDEMEDEIDEMMNELANEEFDRDWGMEEMEDATAHDSTTAGRPTPGENTVGGVRVLSGDDLHYGNTEESDADSLKTYQITTMTDSIEEKLSELDDPVAVEASEVDELRDKADRFEEMSENLEALRERTDILDEVDRSQVEELAESDDPVVKESARYEELQSEAEQVKGVYAAQLSEEYPAFSADELTDKFSIEELREKFEEEIGSVEEELASSSEAEPRSQDADEESLEEAASETEESTEELSESAQEKQAELKQKILERR